MLKLLTSISILFLILLLFPIPASAQEKSTLKQMIRVSPVILKVSLEPGTTQNYQIKVENLLDTPMPLKASVEGFDASDEEYGVTVSDQPQASPLMDWISLDEKDAILPAKTSRDFNVKITVPGKVPIGGYYAMIFFTPIFPGVPVSYKIGVLALANIGVQEKNKAEIATFNFDKALYEKGTISTTIRVKNTSLNYFTAKPTLTIKPLFGSAIWRIELEEKTILPGKIRRWQRSFDLGNLYGGIYTATLSVSLENGDYIYSTAHFIGFPIREFVLILSVLIVIAYSFIYRKRVERAFSLLMKGDKS